MSNLNLSLTLVDAKLVTLNFYLPEASTQGSTRLGVEKVKPCLNIFWDTSFMTKSYQWGWWADFGDWMGVVSAAGILIMAHQVSLMMFSLKRVDYSMSFLLLST